MARASKFSQEVRERAVRMVFEHRGEYASEWEAMKAGRIPDLENSPTDYLKQQRFRGKVPGLPGAGVSGTW